MKYGPVSHHRGWLSPRIPVGDMTLWQELILLTKIAWPGVLSISVGISLSRLVPQVLIRHFSRPDLRRPVFVKGGTHASVPNGGSHHTTELRAVRKHANPSRASHPGRRPAAPQRARGREGVANPPRARSLQGDVATFPQALDRERMSLTLCRREAAGERVPPPPICGREAERGSRGLSAGMRPAGLRGTTRPPCARGRGR